MVEGSLSRRYAKALFELAQEGKSEEEVGAELERFVAAYTDSSLSRVLNHPAIDLKRRSNIALQVAEHLGLSTLSRRFISLLLDRDRLALLPFIASQYRRMLDEAKGRIEALVRAPAPPDKALLERLRAEFRRLSGKEVILRAEAAPDLIGGLQVQLGDKIYDGSVRTQLDRMKERIERGE